MRHHRKQKRDVNHTELCRELQKQGIEVVELLDPLDILVRSRHTGNIGFVEIKAPGSKRTYTLKQLRFIAETTVPVIFASNDSQVIEFLKTGKGLSQVEKDRLAAFCATADKEKYHGQLVARVLRGVEFMSDEVGDV